MASMTATILKIDLSKRVFHLHGVDEHGRTVLSKRVSRTMSLARRRGWVVKVDLFQPGTRQARPRPSRRCKFEAV